MPAAWRCGLFCIVAHPASVEFFVPRADPVDAERYLGELASFVGRPVPSPGHRYLSVTFAHNGEQWTAEVGHKLHGERRVARRRRERPTEVVTRLHDPAVVLAIFPGTRLWQVVTSARPITSVISAWENPFMIGEPSVISGVRFDSPR
jgi:hypothetical protein